MNILCLWGKISRAPKYEELLSAKQLTQNCARVTETEPTAFLGGGCHFNMQFLQDNYQKNF